MNEPGSSATGFPMFGDFEPARIEARWQAVWEAERTWQVSNDAGDQDHGSRRAYVLEQLPYTSGDPHVGHLKNYTVGDAVAHSTSRSPRSVRSSSGGACRSTGAGRSAPTTRPTTAGHSGSSCSCTGPGWPTAAPRR